MNINSQVEETEDEKQMKRTKKCSKCLRGGKLTQGSWKRLRPGKPREDGGFNQCSKLVRQTARHIYASKNTHFPAFSFLWSSENPTSKYLITQAI